MKSEQMITEGCVIAHLKGLVILCLRTKQFSVKSLLKEPKLDKNSAKNPSPNLQAGNIKQDLGDARPTTIVMAKAGHAFKSIKSTAKKLLVKNFTILGHL